LLGPLFASDRCLQCSDERGGFFLPLLAWDIFLRVSFVSGCPRLEVIHSFMLTYLLSQSLVYKKIMELGRVLLLVSVLAFVLGGQLFIVPLFQL
jgi:hypothetical protein